MHVFQRGLLLPPTGSAVASHFKATDKHLRQDKCLKRAPDTLDLSDMSATENLRRRPGLMAVLFKCAEDLAAWLLPFMILDAIVQFVWAQITKPSDFSDGPWQTLWLKVGDLHKVPTG